jgi:hypothetical protein
MTNAPISDLHPDLAPAGGPPAFILTASRSGSTLLRFILDSHPDLACPPETMVGSTCVSMIRLVYSLEKFGAVERFDISAPPDISPESVKAIREFLDNAYFRYLGQRGKSRWCDKSLDTYQCPDLILKIYPEARFVCLVRHAMDVIASGVRNCPWGVSRYGFDPFVAQYPGNSVAAIGAYWLSVNRAILEFCEKNPDCCTLVRYEDLVTAPEAVMADVLDFIDASPAPGITRACFTVAHEARGPGDEKIWFTDRVSADSMGQGVTVPPAALPPEMRASINEVLTKLGYRTVDDDWQSAVGAMDPRASLPGGPATATGGDHGDAAVESAVGTLRARLGSGAAVMSQAILAQWPSVAGVTVRLVAQGPGGDHAEIRWRFPDGNGTHAPDGGPGIPLMVASPATWMSLLDGQANLMNEVLLGRFRCVNPNDSHRARSDELHAVGALLGLAPVPVQPL